MKRAFTLVELLIVIAIITLLMALGLPVARLARERGAEAVCSSNLHQMTVMLKAYCNDHDNLFPNPTYLYHSRESYKFYKHGEPFDPPYGGVYPWACRWHEAEIGPSSPMMRQKKEFQGDLLAYVGNPKVLLCRTGARACLERGCNPDVNEPRRPQPAPPRRGRRGRGRGRGQDGPDIDGPNQPFTITPQYSYMMNGNLHRTFLTASTTTGSPSAVAAKTVRTTTICKETQVRRSPSVIFAFGEENSWPVNTESRWPAPYNLSGPWGGTQDGTMDTFLDAKDRKASRFRVTGSLTTGSLDIGPSYTTFDSPVENPHASRMPETDVGDAFATYHRPRGGDLNTGHSYISMLDGHVQKVTVSDQLRRSRQDPNLPPSRFGPGGNLYIAWPLDIPPLGGWENQ
ncbi:MAG TPA: type II secretion system protein [Sedimentisphaerales bacterium]|jgi:prepilin-type N-terminal cleavage/methylation domain-containing protein|nr:type II secretion system protein [Sedimentisphaerales bacterium]HNU29667.1 type II secretion system protein [Sedimentisphaerales bacterium]